MSRSIAAARRAFTLVELLVVIGIIALLISILLPSLNSARETARTIKCASNLRSVGQGFALYISTNKGIIPAAVQFAENSIVGDQQLGPGNVASGWTSRGYISWSSLIGGKVYSSPADQAFTNNNTFQQFQCPSVDKGGLPPANTYAENRDGLDNETPGVLDQQAPRLAYTVNEALCPRGRFGKGVNGATYATPYHYVRAGSVKASADVILGTELWGVQQLAQTKSQNGANQVSNSRRPVSGFLASGTNGVATKADNFYESTAPRNIPQAAITDIQSNPSADLTWVSGTITCTASFIGRNHGTKKIGSVQGPNGSIGNWDLRRTNFLYLDGHVETKNVADTLFPVNQWGDQFYDLVR